MCDCIKLENEKIRFELEKKFKNKFTVKFNGEFFIAAAHDSQVEFTNEFVSENVVVAFIKGNYLFLTPKDSWLKKSVNEINEAEIKDCDIAILSQIKRLEKQIEFGLTGTYWGKEAYTLARDILYLLHTKSQSIRYEVARRCAREYNIMQREKMAPNRLAMGYKNALCHISSKM